MKYLLLLGLVFLSKNSFSQTDLAKKVITQLKLDKADWQVDFFIEKQMPNLKDQTIVVLSEKIGEDDGMFSLRSWIVVFNTKTGKIKAKKALEIDSDAIRFAGFTIDTAPYLVAKGKRAFGIRMLFEGSSRPNPYTSEVISLFLEEKGQLIEVLKEYEIEVHQGEWDTNCEGEFNSEKKVLIIGTTQTNSYFDIIVNSKIGKETNYVDENEDCQSKSESSTKKYKLVYKNKVYTEISL
ncbi:MAG: hypothetical protein ACK476_13170 [Fluviicola sp.]|jgi:hypothetical protein